VNDTYTIHAFALCETARALLCAIAGQEIWVPLSQIHRDSEVRRRGDSGLLLVAAWWARKAALIDDDEDSYHEREAHSQHGAAPATVELTQATRTYRRLAQEFHPDRIGGDGKTMQALNVLWDAVRSDVERCNGA
jgi:hypothetical protein